jgi:hypothetical protein
MSAELKTYAVGPDTVGILGENKYEDYSFRRYGDFAFRKSTNKIMDKLWAYFYKNETYPEYYLGIAKRVAICKCPITGEEEWFNGERCLKVENPMKGSIVTVHVQIKTRNYSRDFIFLGWVKVPVHEWRMKKGTTLMLEQKVIDCLLPEDKRYLKINV